jgi:hypothetical protein
MRQFYTEDSLRICYASEDIPLGLSILFVIARLLPRMMPRHISCCRSQLWAHPRIYAGKDVHRAGTDAHLHAFSKELAEIKQALSNSLRWSNPEKVVRPDLVAW